MFDRVRLHIEQEYASQKGAKVHRKRWNDAIAIISPCPDRTGKPKGVIMGFGRNYRLAVLGTLPAMIMYGVRAGIISVTGFLENYENYTIRNMQHRMVTNFQMQEWFKGPYMFELIALDRFMESYNQPATSNTPGQFDFADQTKRKGRTELPSGPGASDDYVRLGMSVEIDPTLDMSKSFYSRVVPQALWTKGLTAILIINTWITELCKHPQNSSKGERVQMMSIIKRMIPNDWIRNALLYRSFCHGNQKRSKRTTLNILQLRGFGPKLMTLLRPEEVIFITPRPIEAGVSFNGLINGIGEKIGLALESYDLEDSTPLGETSRFAEGLLEVESNQKVNSQARIALASDNPTTGLRYQWELVGVDALHSRWECYQMTDPLGLLVDKPLIKVIAEGLTAEMISIKDPRGLTFTVFGRNRILTLDETAQLARRPPFRLLDGVTPGVSYKRQNKVYSARGPIWSCISRLRTFFPKRTPSWCYYERKFSEGEPNLWVLKVFRIDDWVETDIELVSISDPNEDLRVVQTTGILPRLGLRVVVETAMDFYALVAISDVNQQHGGSRRHWTLFCPTCVSPKEYTSLVMRFNDNPAEGLTDDELTRFYKYNGLKVPFLKTHKSYPLVPWPASSGLPTVLVPLVNPPGLTPGWKTVMNLSDECPTDVLAFFGTRISDTGSTGQTVFSQCFFIPAQIKPGDTFASLQGIVVSLQGEQPSSYGLRWRICPNYIQANEDNRIALGRALMPRLSGRSVTLLEMNITDLVEELIEAQYQDELKNPALNIITQSPLQAPQALPTTNMAVDQVQEPPIITHPPTITAETRPILISAVALRSGLREPFFPRNRVTYSHVDIVPGTGIDDTSTVVEML
jgi:hypothetical protein